MMPLGVSGPAVLAAGIAAAILLASAIWAHYRFSRYEKLPRQFGLTLKPQSYGPPWLIIWFMPSMLIATLALVVLLPSFVRPENINGDPSLGAIIASVVTVSAQGFVLWLVTRWANEQG